MIGCAVSQLVEHGWPIRLSSFLQDERLERAFDRVAPDVLCFQSKSQSFHNFFGGSEPLKSHLEKIPRSCWLHYSALDRPRWLLPALIVSRETPLDNPIPFVDGP